MNNYQTNKYKNNSDQISYLFKDMNNYLNKNITIL